MTTGNNVSLLAERILAVQHKYESSRRWSHQRLFIEHLRRMALWIKANNWVDVLPVMSDISIKLFPTIRADQAKVQLVQAHLQDQKVTYLTRACISALHWAAIEDLPQVRGYGLPRPYEPLVLLYERGGYIGRDHHYWVVSGATGGLRRWSFYESIPPLELDQRTLNEIDTNGKTDWECQTITQREE